MSILCVSEMRTMKLFSLGFRVVVHVPCYLSEVLMLLFFSHNIFHLIVTFLLGLFKQSMKPGPHSSSSGLGMRLK